jgi:hypothetical protein
MTEQKRKSRKPVFLFGALLALLLTGGIAYGIAALTVTVPLFPAVGQAVAQPCDPDGVNTSFTYGNSSANGIRVTSATVSGIAAACATATVEFVTNAGTVVENKTGNVSGGSTTVNVNVWTNDFDDVRVVLNP